MNEFELIAIQARNQRMVWNLWASVPSSASRLGAVRVVGKTDCGNECRA